jgi:hypothetical protein
MRSDSARPFDCCQNCGARIGLLGRLFQWIGLGIHRCPGAREAFDFASARRANAEAERLELENAGLRQPPSDDGRNPVHVEGWKAGGRSDLGIVNATLFDREERGYELTLLPAQARELAEALLSGARFAETGRER